MRPIRKRICVDVMGGYGYFCDFCGSIEACHGLRMLRVARPLFSGARRCFYRCEPPSDRTELSRMVAESLSPGSGPGSGSGIGADLSAGLVAVPASALGWAVFVALIGVVVMGVPIAARSIRRGLPARERAKRSVAPMNFGSSQKVRRSPRHAVLLHRSLLVTLFITLVVFLILPGVLAIRELGVSAIQVGLTLVLPTLLVTLHARRRGQGT